MTIANTKEAILMLSFATCLLACGHPQIPNGAKKGAQPSSQIQIADGLRERKAKLMSRMKLDHRVTRDTLAMIEAMVTSHSELERLYAAPLTLTAVFEDESCYNYVADLVGRRVKESGGEERKAWLSIQDELYTNMMRGRANRKLSQ